MWVKCRASWSPVKITWTRSVRKPAVRCRSIVNALIYNTKDIIVFDQYDNGCVGCGLCRTQCNKQIEAMKEECNRKIAASKLEKQRTSEKVALQIQLWEKKMASNGSFILILIYLVSLTPQSLSFTECWWFHAESLCFKSQIWCSRHKPFR